MFEKKNANSITAEEDIDSWNQTDINKHNQRERQKVAYCSVPKKLHIIDSLEFCL